MYRYRVTLMVGGVPYETDEYWFRIEAQERFVNQVVSARHLQVIPDTPEMNEQMRRVNLADTVDLTVDVGRWSVKFEALGNE